MYVFRFVSKGGEPHIGVQDDEGGRYDATRILPTVFQTIATWLSNDDPVAALHTVITTGSNDTLTGGAFLVPPDVELLAPVDTQEVWACGVTYSRSKTARMEESKEAGGGDFYDRVYEAERPELFFKSAGWRVVAPGKPIRIRRDSTWNVPEPEMVLVVSSRGEIIAITAGNDVSSRSIEGENPLYLPQAKTYDGGCAIGPVLHILSEPDTLRATPIALSITRGSEKVFAGDTSTAQMKRTPEELVGFLFRETAFPAGAFLFTGTGIIPGDEFTLQSGDIVSITVGDVGTLTNPVA